LAWKLTTLNGSMGYGLLVMKQNFYRSSSENALFNPTVAGGNGKGGCGNSISQPYKFRLVRECRKFNFSVATGQRSNRLQLN
jgi:hypothetical protein